MHMWLLAFQRDTKNSWHSPFKSSMEMLISFWVILLQTYKNEPSRNSKGKRVVFAGYVASSLGHD